MSATTSLPAATRLTTPVLAVEAEVETQRWNNLLLEAVLRTQSRLTQSLLLLKPGAREAAAAARPITLSTLKVVLPVVVVVLILLGHIKAVIFRLKLQLRPGKVAR